jgi:peptidylprolyl isomerase
MSASNGDTVKVHYTGSLTDGSVFDSSDGRDPLEVTLGQGQLIAGFEKALLGMTVGDEKEVTIPADEAYGPYRDEMVLFADNDAIPPDMEVAVGQQVQLRQGEGAVVATVTDVTDDGITLDANHPLAGKDLVFAIELVEIAK